jgi:hypothetical protein
MTKLERLAQLEAIGASVEQRGQVYVVSVLGRGECIRTTSLETIGQNDLDNLAGRARVNMRIYSKHAGA